MTYDEFISLVKQPETVNASHESELKEMLDLYPSFIHARFLYLKVLQLTKGVNFDFNFKKAPIYCLNKHWLYYYLYPENKLSNEVYRRETEGKSSGDYFDMIDRVEREGGDTKQSFKQLAEKLKSARSLVVGSAEKIESNKIAGLSELKAEIEPLTQNMLEVPDYFLNDDSSKVSESIVKKLVAEKKYVEAVEILRKLNLNNPKKSVYFADQIRFLDKIIANLKK